MAGHSHAKNVMHRKAVQGARRARAYGKLIREITVSAKSACPTRRTTRGLRAAGEGGADRQHDARHHRPRHQARRQGAAGETTRRSATRATARTASP
jgi:transcriptional/translational regulatory protein YebC/TACO1